MANKDTLISEFTEAKWDAKATLDHIVITPTMTQGIQARPEAAHPIGTNVAEKWSRSTPQVPHHPQD